MVRCDIEVGFFVCSKDSFVVDILEPRRVVTQTGCGCEGYAGVVDDRVMLTRMLYVRHNEGMS